MHCNDSKLQILLFSHMSSITHSMQKIFFDTILSQINKLNLLHFIPEFKLNRRHIQYTNKDQSKLIQNPKYPKVTSLSQIHIIA